MAGGTASSISFNLPPRFVQDNSGYSFITVTSGSSGAALSMIIYVFRPDTTECLDGGNPIPLKFGENFVRSRGNLTCRNLSEEQQNPITISRIRYGEPASYKFMVTYEGGAVPSEVIKFEPSYFAHPEKGCKGSDRAIRKKFNIRCVDATTETAVGTCSYRIDVPFPTLATQRAGHNHPGAPFTGRRSILSTDFAGVPKDGLDIEFEVPDFSAEFDLQFFGQAMVFDEAGLQNFVFQPITAHFEVRTKGSEKWVDLTSDGLRVIRDGGDSQPSHGLGYYGTPEMKKALDEMLVEFRDILKSEDEKAEIPILRSEAANLPWGGLYDIRQDWLPPHCGHRDGTNIDLSISRLFPSGGTTPMTNRELGALSDAVRGNNMRFPVINEAPECTSNPDAPGCDNKRPTHWHAVLTKSAQ